MSREEDSMEKAIAFTIDQRARKLLALLENDNSDIQYSVACTVLGRLLCLCPERATDLLIKIGVAIAQTEEIINILPFEAKLIIYVQNPDSQTKH